MKQKTILSIFVLLFLCVTISAQTPTKWRGDNANGVYNETGLLKSWPANGPGILWHFDALGDGYSSPVFYNNKIYVTGMVEPTGYVHCLSNDGKLLWEKEYGTEWFENFPGSRTSPVIMEGKLYMYTGNGIIQCMDAETGDKLWSKDVMNDLDGRNIRWGVTETLVIDGDILYCTPGGVVNNVIALNRNNGDLIWANKGEGEKSAYCTPLLIELPSKKILVTMTENHIIGLNAATGQKLWSYEQTNRWSVHANTPVYHDGGLFCFSGYGQGGVKLKLSADGNSVSKEWFLQDLDSRMGGIVLIDGVLYGSGDKYRSWKAVDWKTGEIKYESEEISKGVVIAADGMLFCYGDRGEIALVKVDPTKFVVSGKANVELGTAQHWAHPVLNQGRFFIRHGQSLIAYKVK